MEPAQEKCSTYRPGSPPITRKEAMELLSRVPGWSLEHGHLTRQFELPDSSQCVEFMNEIATLGIQEGHMPDITLRESRYVTVSFYTYAAGGLTRNDFIMAAKVSTLGHAQ
ncbi:MAG: 4a-hydroxytetrahydrobiopterin dehydratase [Methanoregula sp.]|nr:4a-hydroxytetrahydrobiopterin dehydratase [Methanoregula sp.]